MSSHTVSSQDSGIRIDAFLSAQLNTPRNKVQQIIKKGRVWVGPALANKPARFLKAGEMVTITDDWDKNEFPSPENIPLHILYEDEHILVINKPAGQVVHPIHKEDKGTVVNALLFHYPDICQAVYEPDNQISLLRPGIVHRLDKDTSGVLLIAKTLESMKELAKQFQSHSVKKTYLALLYGHLTDRSDIHTSMRRQKKGNVSRMKAQRELEQGREAKSVFIPMQTETIESRSVTLAEIQILTGRTHQIRSHARYIGHPVLGDAIYGMASSKNLSKKLGIPRQMLHAASLTFTHPTTHKQLRIEASIPDDFAGLCRRLQLLTNQGSP